MGKIHVKSVDKTEKVLFFNQLINGLANVRNATQPGGSGMAVQILYRIFGSGNKAVHYSGTYHQVDSWEELIGIFNINNEQLSVMELTPVELEREVCTFIGIFEQLKAEGFDFYYANPGSQVNSQTLKNLERASLLVANLKIFLAEEAEKGNFIDEYISFNGPEIPKLQEHLHRQILQTKIRELFPDVLLYSYYTVYQKLPLS